MENQEIKTLSVKKNYVFNLLIQIITYLIPLVTAPYLSRTLTPTGVGNNSFVNSITSYFILFISFGFTTYGIKEISSLKHDKEEISKVFWNILFSRGFIFIIAFTIYIVTAYLCGFNSDVDKSIFYIYSILLLNAFIDMTFFFQGLENFRIISITNVICRIGAAICYFIFVKSINDLFVYVFIFTSTSLIINIVAWIFAIKKLDIPNFKSINIFKCIKKNIPYFLPDLAISIYTMLDRTMLGYLANQEQVGYYEEAYKIIAIVTGLMTAISPVILPRISALIQDNNEDEVRNKIIKMGEIFFLLGLPCCVGLYTIARYFIPAFFGEEYLESVNVIYWLIPLTMIIPISSYAGNAYFYPRGKIAYSTIFFTCGALLNFSTNFIFIKLFGASGAAMTSLMAETLISTLCIIFSRKSVPYKTILKKGIKPLIAVIIMAVCILPLSFLVLDKYIESNLYKSLICVGVGVIAYGGSIVLLKEEMVVIGLYKVKSKLFKK